MVATEEAVKSFRTEARIISLPKGYNFLSFIGYEDRLFIKSSSPNTTICYFEVRVSDSPQKDFMLVPITVKQIDAGASKPM